ncbi:hypothetical protein SH668x_001840 [Planctomicrobium sp. SH668]|uniref:hypothetical protein n=1 Tax=Planctomicrobium sp. SH668 TaxID=3448126 RepID=UPI003F5BFA23
MQEHLIEICVGETIMVGQCRITVLKTQGDELFFEIDGDGEGDSSWGSLLDYQPEEVA